jgi:hypothetical protein
MVAKATIATAATIEAAVADIDGEGRAVDVDLNTLTSNVESAAAIMLSALPHTEPERSNLQAGNPIEAKGGRAMQNLGVCCSLPMELDGQQKGTQESQLQLLSRVAATAGVKPPSASTQSGNSLSRACSATGCTAEGKTAVSGTTGSVLDVEQTTSPVSATVAYQEGSPVGVHKGLAGTAAAAAGDAPAPAAGADADADAKNGAPSGTAAAAAADAPAADADACASSAEGFTARHGRAVASVSGAGGSVQEEADLVLVVQELLQEKAKLQQAMAQVKQGEAWCISEESGKKEGCCIVKKGR